MDILFQNDLSNSAAKQRLLKMKKMFQPFISLRNFGKVQVGNDQEMTKSERNYENRGRQITY